MNERNTHKYARAMVWIKPEESSIKHNAQKLSHLHLHGVWRATVSLIKWHSISRRCTHAIFSLFLTLGMCDFFLLYSYAHILKLPLPFSLTLSLGTVLPLGSMNIFATFQLHLVYNLFMDYLLPENCAYLHGLRTAMCLYIKYIVNPFKLCLHHKR